MGAEVKIDTSDAAKLKESLEGLLNISKEARAEVTSLRTYIDEKMKDANDEKKAFGGTFADTREKLKEITEKAGEGLGKIAKVEQDILKHHDALEKLNAEIQRRGGRIADSEEAKAQRKLLESTAGFLQVKAAEKCGPGDKVPRFSADQVTADQVKEYEAGKAALAKIMRFGTDIKEAQVLYANLSADEQKAISTFTHGNRYWLQTELSDMIIACYRMDTDLTAIVNNIAISRGAVEFLTDHYVGADATFKCETDCAPKTPTMEPQPGTLNIAVNEMTADECITNTMLEDAVINVEMWLAQKIGGKFIRRINNAILTGTGQGMPDGIMNANNHLTFPSGNVAGTPAGDFTWQDLMLMSIKLEPRFQMGAMWLIGTNALASIMTMTDSLGRPIFSAQVLNDAGMPKLMGKPFVQVVQMPDYLAADGAKVQGSKPIALGDWKSHYMMVHRRGFTMMRDPYSMMNCGVRYHFSQRVGGGVLCRNAAIFLQIT